MWLTPKLDWSSESYINIDDYNRIKGNIEYLHGLAVQVTASFPIDAMGSDKKYSDLPYAYEWNRVEANLKLIDDWTTNLIDEDIKSNLGSNYFDNGKYIIASQLNTIESYSLAICNVLRNSIKNKQRLPFRLKGGRF